MTTKTELQRIGESSLNPWDKFMEIIEPYRSTLWNYCRKLTGSPWDAEDLFQDTLLKSFASLTALSHRNQPLQPKSFLFRVATNHWIDQCRRHQKLKFEDYDEIHQTVCDESDALEVTEAVLRVVHYLPIRQAVVFILLESFQFTAKEAAQLLSVTEGAVYAMMNRARTTLKNALEQAGDDDFPSIPGSLGQTKTQALAEFISAYNERDFHRLASFLIDESTFSFVASGSTEYGKNAITTYSLNPDKVRNLPNELRVKSVTLWGQPALIYAIDTPEGSKLFDVNTLVWEDGYITHWKCYYFCREFMHAAAKELGLTLLPIQANFQG